MPDQATTPSPSQSLQPPNQGDEKDDENSNQQDEILFDVNTFLQKLATSSTSFDYDDSNDSDDGTVVTLTEPELTSLRKLNKRIRTLIEERQRTFRRTVTGDEKRRIRDHARDKIKQTAKQTRHSVEQTARRVVTGDSSKRIADWAREAKVVKTVDKFSFMLGVFSLLSTEYVLLKYPQHFGYFYVAVMSYMIVLRIYLYSKARYIYFLIDFCYFTNASCFVSVLLLPQNSTLWRINYASSNGLLLAAILAWRNSLVFHSLDKITSFALHMMPCLLTFLQRWPSDGSSAMCPQQLDEGNAECKLGVQGAFTDPVLFYISWQAYYIIQTEVIDRERLKGDPDLATSMRWITRDTKNPMHKMALSACRATGILKQNEKFDPETVKTKTVFVAFQLFFMMSTLVPVPFMFSNCDFHWVCLMLVFGFAVWNGSNYYFEVFAARYIQKFEDQKKVVAAVGVSPAKGGDDDKLACAVTKEE
mmetsp:Transcript_8663/g.12570  ORF Transcript_8663/g.12570 Transcript_8663/m.12570 type:complete len:475 (+) Transcript_8663:36-1460(+)